MTNNDIKRIREIMEFLLKKEISKELQHLSKKEKRVYDLIGSKKQLEIAQDMGISTGGISGILQKLEEKGVLVKEGAQYKRLV